MAKLLYIKASPRGDRSHAMAVANAFVEAYKAKHSGDEVIECDVFKENLIPFDGPAVQAKYTVLHGEKPSAEEMTAWKDVEKTIAGFTSANTYIFAVPMWNFGIPYRLKHYFDIIVQPGYTFSFTPEEGYTGLMKGKRAFVAYARGGEYAEGTAGKAFDYQQTYMDCVLNFMGITDITSVVVEPTLMGGPAMADERQKAAIDEARKVAGTF